MNYYVIPSAFIIALLFTFLFYALSGRGTGRAILLFFFIIFLVSWAGQLWLTPFGPFMWGVSFMPLIFTALIFSSLLIALFPSEKKSDNPSAETKQEETPAFTIGMFFWFLIVILIVSIVIGYYKVPTV